MAKRKDEGKPKDEEVGRSGDADDSFGLPEIEYEPLNRGEETPSETEADTRKDVYASEDEPAAQEETPAYSGESYTYTYSNEERSPAGPKIVGIIAVILLALAAIYYFAIHQPGQRQEAERVRIAAEQAEQQRAEQARQAQLAEQRARDEAARRAADSLAALPKEGSIQMLESRTGRYYVVITSALDDDLLMDYANKLSKENVSTMVIPPFGSYKFYRLAIAEGASFSEAQGKADELKTQYGEKVWVLRY